MAPRGPPRASSQSKHRPAVHDRLSTTTERADFATADGIGCVGCERVTVCSGGALEAVERWRFALTVYARSDASGVGVDPWSLG